MSAVISDKVMMKEVLKATGFDCPQGMENKTFEQATSGGSSSGDRTKQQLDVTANGSYTTPEGVYYDPIFVNVPLSAVSVKMETVLTDKLTTVGTPVTLSYEYDSKLDANYVVWVGSEQINTRDLVADQTYNYTITFGSYNFDITLKKEKIGWGRDYKVTAEFKDRGHVTTNPPLDCYLIIGTLRG